MTQPAGDVVLSVKGVAKRLGSRRVLREASLTVARGEACALLGDNGAGKSTLLRVIAGVIPADAGEVRIGGLSLGRDRVRALAGLGYAPEQADLPDAVRGSEWLDLVAALRRVPREKAGSPPLGVSAFGHQLVSSLSLGQRRRLVLAAAWIGAPPLLVLDEPTNALDVEALGAVADALAAHTRQGGALLFATHDRAFLERLSARVLRIVDGDVR